MSFAGRFILYRRFAELACRQLCNSHLVVGCARFCSRSSSGFALLVDSDNWLHFLPHRGFVTETHIDFSLEISGNSQAVRHESDGGGSVQL